MTSAFISPAVYTLDERKSNWSAEQQKGISTLYPFHLQPSGLDDYVARTYLQFLWLPNSLMPLSHLVPSLRRVEAHSASSSTVSHPMHALLKPLLLTTRLVTNKYHSELVKILENGGGAGEMEEAMMWYAVEHEKPLGVDRLPVPSPRKHGQDGEEGQWTNEKWREQYLERMEQREVQIQILLYMFKLSLPGPYSQPSSDADNVSKVSRSGKRKRGSMSTSIEPVLTVEDHLEVFMDKLAMWQLVGRIDDAFGHGSGPSKKINSNVKDERDWIQIFVEDVVEPHFKAQLPELCKILRTKVFPTSPFSDTESGASARNPSPEPTVVPHPPVPTGVPLKKALSRTSSTSFTRAPSLSRYIPSPSRSATTAFSSRGLVRSRSSSLSLSLAQEQEERAAAAAAAAEQQTRKRGRFHREVSMTRVFKKGKSKNLGGPVAEAKKDVRGSTTVKVEAPKVEKIRGDKGVTLVDDTPIKPRISTLERTKTALIEPINLKIASKGDNNPTAPTFTEDEDHDEEWIMNSSPAVVVFDPELEKQKTKAQIFTAIDEGDGSEEEWDKKSSVEEEKAMQMTPSRNKLTRKRSRKK